LWNLKLVKLYMNFFYVNVICRPNLDPGIEATDCACEILYVYVYVYVKQQR